jgi:Ca-activated chloride channel family protein
MWAGNYIKYLETQSQTNDIVDEIVNYSINERVLSVYSAFLCLEPSRGGEVCYDCLDESELPDDVSDSLETQNDSLSLSAYPNPFNSQITLNVKLQGLVSQENLTFRIYDILGRQVKTFEPELTLGQREYRFRWDGTNDEGYSIASGIYFFIVTTPEKNYSVKLLLMK